MNFSRILLTSGLLLFAVDATAVEATYTVKFDVLWNGSTHPNNFPSSAHFSPLIGVSHDAGVPFWAPGQTATLGIENVAEIGLATAFRGELDAAISAGNALERIEISSNLFSGQSGTTNEFTVNDEFPLITLASMVAPSSDWFIGVHDLDLRTASSFTEELVIEFDSFYDAGTEEGNLFSLSNPATSPQGVITEITGEAAAAPFRGSGFTNLAPIARFTITRQSLSVPEPSSILLIVIGALTLRNARHFRRVDASEKQ